MLLTQRTRLSFARIRMMCILDRGSPSQSVEKVTIGLPLSSLLSPTIRLPRRSLGGMHRSGSGVPPTRLAPPAGDADLGGMKICFVTPRFPYPAIKGDTLRAFHQIQALSGRHQITL